MSTDDQIPEPMMVAALRAHDEVAGKEHHTKEHLVTAILHAGLYAYLKLLKPSEAKK